MGTPADRVAVANAVSRSVMQLPRILIALGLLLALGGTLLWLGLATAASAQTTGAVDTGDDWFSPYETTVNVGDTVVWRNVGEEVHAATANAGSFDSGLFGPGESWQYTFSTPGTFSYYCLVHGRDMAGTVVVEAVEPVGPVEPAPPAPADPVAAPVDPAPIIDEPPRSPVRESADVEAAPPSSSGQVPNARQGQTEDAELPVAGFGPVGIGGNSPRLALILWAVGGSMLAVAAFVWVRSLRRTV